MFNSICDTALFVIGVVFIFELVQAWRHRKKKCRRCYGRGWLWMPHNPSIGNAALYNAGMFKRIECLDCNGKGKV